MKKKRRATRRKRGGLTAKNADRHDLYQRSVQDAEMEADFIELTFRRMTGRKAKRLREDFCGTALLCAEWARRGEDRFATGVDLDARTLSWGEAHNLAPLGDARARVTIVKGNVLDPAGSRFDVICAYNFSYWIFKERATMLRYFRRVHRSLARGGAFFLDTYGGSEAQVTLTERRRIKGGFRYVWEQHSVNPIDSSIVNYIHFEFPDGSRLRRAFRYDWRLWTMRELSELLEEAGFSRSVVYWETDAAHGKGSGVLRPRKKSENHKAWLAYIVATK